MENITSLGENGIWVPLYSEARLSLPQLIGEEEETLYSWRKGYSFPAFLPFSLDFGPFRPPYNINFIIIWLIQACFPWSRSSCIDNFQRKISILLSMSVSIAAL